MEELEHPTEHVQEDIHEQVHESKERWISGVAVTAALLAALAAITNLLSGHHEHEAMVQQIQASDQWNYYQAKGIKAAVLEGRVEAMEARKEPVPESVRSKVEGYAEQQKEIREKAKGMSEASEKHDACHFTLAGAVTLFQVAIAIAAVSALTRRPAFWYLGIALGVVGVALLAAGLVAQGRIPALAAG